MGIMKNIFIDICNANDGKLPGEITAGDVRKMKELEIYNWKKYQLEIEKKKINKEKEKT